MQVRRDYELLRMKYEHYLKTNEQTGRGNYCFRSFGTVGACKVESQ